MKPQHTDRYEYSFRQMAADLSYDLIRYQHRLSRPGIVLLMFMPGLQALVAYRISHWLNTRSKLNNPLWWPVLLFDLMMIRFVEIVTSIQLHSSADIGPGLYMPHFSGIVIGEGVKLGRNCDLYHNTTVGFSGSEDEPGGYPTIGDRVLILTGAVITGKITIGHDVIIGANALVIKSVPDRGVVGGVPAKILSHKGSFFAVQYPNMETDPDRQDSMALRNQGAHTQTQDYIEA